MSTALTPILCARAGGGDITAGLVTADPTGNTFPAGGSTYIRVKNGNAGAVTVTATPSAASGPLGTTVAPLALSPVVAPTTGDRLFGPFPQNPFGDQNGNVTITCAPSTTVQVAALVMSG